jgi:hypothetical protein
MQHTTNFHGLPVGADIATIKAAYKTLVRTHHPDRGGDPKVMAEINSIYQDLMEGKIPERTTPSQEPTYSAPAAPQRPTSPFGWRRQQEAAAKSAAQEMEEKKRQEAAWFADQEAMRARQAKAAYTQTQQQFQTPEERAAYLRALRESRMPGPAARAETTAEPPRATPDTPLAFKVSSTFTSKYTSEVIVDDRLHSAMQAKKQSLMDDEARRVVQGRRAGEDPQATQAIHLVQKMRVEGDTVHMYLGSPGKAGRNIVVAPSLERDGDSIKIGKTPAALAMTLPQPGKQSHSGAESILVSNGKGLKVALHYADQVENLRQTTQSRTR